MKNENVLFNPINILPISQQKISSQNRTYMTDGASALPQILFITSYVPRECGIATYSQDLIKALNNKFNHSFKIEVCALESENEKYTYNDDVKYILNTDHPTDFVRIAKNINDNPAIKMVMIQHEFGFFNQKEADFNSFLNIIYKPIILGFHTILPHPDEVLRTNVQQISDLCESIIVMTNSSAEILINEYGIEANKINVIPHGTHLVPHTDKNVLKEKYKVLGKTVLSTFGLLSSGKNIETTLDALPAIVKKKPDVLFLIIGKTHPSVVKQEGEKYRLMLETKVETLQLQQHVLFVNHYLTLPDLSISFNLFDTFVTLGHAIPNFSPRRRANAARSDKKSRKSFFS